MPLFVRSASFDCYKVYPLPGTRANAFRRIEDDLSMKMGAQVRIVAMEDCVGVEVPRKDRAPVLLQDCIEDENWRGENDFCLPVILGVDCYSQLRVIDLAALPDLLVAGATKQGKTVFLRNLILTLIWKKNPEDLMFVLIDSKENGLIPLATDAYHAEKMLSTLCLELKKRYEQLSSAGVREVKSYKKKLKDGQLSTHKGHRHLPYIVVSVMYMKT